MKAVVEGQCQIEGKRNDAGFQQNRAAQHDPQPGEIPFFHSGAVLNHK